MSYPDWHLFLAHYKYYIEKIEGEIKSRISPEYSENMKKKVLSERLKENEDYQLLLESYEENKKKRPFICNICGTSFRSKKDGLLPHLIKVHGINPLQRENENKENESVNTSP